MKKKGFTLIELLAVIVILAIIALIATPIILNIVNNAKKGAAKSSALGYIDAVEKTITIGKFDSNKGISIPSDNNLSLENEDDALILSKIKVKGTEPSYVSLQFEKGKVKKASFCINDYSFDYIDSKIKSSSFNYCTGASVSKVEITNIETSLDVGGELQLNVNITATKNDYTVRYLSSEESVAIVSETGMVTALKKGEVTITVEAGYKKSSIKFNITGNNSILGYIENNELENDTIININIANQNYKAHVYNFDGNQIWNDEQIFGNDSDIASSTENAKNMVIVKVNGDLTIGESGIVRPYYTEYGGPKGFLMYVAGTLTNNGTIDNSHGAKAEGEDVYLWKNIDGTYEYIPAVGSDGGAAFVTTNQTRQSGNNGLSALEGTRKTGGGGNGASSNPNRNGTINMGNGGKGTSYSGGAGLGGCYHGNSSFTISDTNDIGGAGGGAVGSFSPGSSGGGAGNPGGNGHTGEGRNGSNALEYKGANGTGGLLIIYSNTFINNGTLSAKGSNGGPGIATGGGSGGGSINVFYMNSSINGNTDVSGGTGGEISDKGTGTVSNGSTNYGKTGGTGGNGSVTFTKIN